MHRFGLRLDDDLYDKARTAAKEQDRSLNWWIANLIRQATNTPTAKPQEQQ